MSMSYGGIGSSMGQPVHKPTLSWTVILIVVAILAYHFLVKKK